MNHNIETADFSSSDEEESPLFVPSADLLNHYNREYSLIVREVEKFLKEVHYLSM